MLNSGFNLTLFQVQNPHFKSLIYGLYNEEVGQWDMKSTQKVSGCWLNLDAAYGRSGCV